jgi:ABC-type dipeptide/oligopeptide/nickel transport system permease subunit
MATAVATTTSVAARGATIAALVWAVLAALAVGAPLLAPHDPLEVRTARILEGPSREFPAGTDHLGRCVLSRVLHAARWSIGSAIVVTAMVVVIGTAVGVVAGLSGAVADVILMRVVDTVLALPALLLALAVIGLLGPGVAQVIAAFSAVWWARYARLVRSLVVSLREADHVTAALGAGAGWRHLTVRHILPALAKALVVVSAIDFGEFLLLLSAVSFLGLGVPPPTPEWGAMLNDARGYVLTHPRLTLLPGSCLALTIASVNLMSDAARDAWEVRRSPGRLTGR